MGFLKRIGIDSYMLMLLGTVMVGLVLPARGVAADALGQVTYWAVALLFFLYGAKLDPASVKAGMLNWRLQGLTFAATYLMIPVLGMAFALIMHQAFLGRGLTRAVILIPWVIPRALSFSTCPTRFPDPLVSWPNALSCAFFASSSAPPTRSKLSMKVESLS